MTHEEEERSWEAVRARWADDETHRAFLAGFTDLEGLARAGRRYQEALTKAPGDPVATRWRAEILKRATVQGLASLPRTPPPRPVPRWLKWALIVASSALLAAAMAWLARALVTYRG